MEDNKRIVVAYAWYRPTGAAKRLKRAVLALANSGVKVEYVAVKAPEFDHKNITVHIIPTPERLKPKSTRDRPVLFWAHFMIASSFKCCRLALKKEVTHLLGFVFSAAFSLMLARIVTRKKLIVFIRSDEIEENNLKNIPAILKLIFRIQLRMLCRLSSRFVSVNQTFKDKLINEFGDYLKTKATVLFNDIPSPTSSSSSRNNLLKLINKKDAFLITTASHFDHRKNVAQLIHAAKHTPDQAHIILIGAGPEIPNLQQLTKELKLSDRVFFAMWRDNAHEMIAGSDLFVLPSVSEGMSNALMEALTNNIPCLASRIPVHTETLLADDTLFEINDHMELANKIRRMIEEPEYRMHVSDACKIAAKRYKFDWDSQVVENILI